MQDKADRNADHPELVVLVRGTCDEIREDGELNVLLRGFAANLLKRRLTAKVEFLEATELDRGGAVNPKRSFATNWKLPTGTVDTIVVISDKINKFTERLIINLKQLKIHLQGAYRELTKLVRSVADKPRRLREASQARERDLRNLLTTSFDAIVVTDVDRRFVAANSRALELFGISERNIGMFTIDAFLPLHKSAGFDKISTPVIHRKGSHSKCQIKNLRGNLLVAEYTFVANVVPKRHMYRFRDIAPHEIAPFNPKLPVNYQRHWAVNQHPI